MVTQGRVKLDLMRLCGQVTSVTQSTGASVSTVGSGASSSNEGNCQHSYQLDSALSKCGDRAADQRPGGR